MSGLDRIYYFAYGSNLWSGRINDGGRKVEKMANACLKGYELEFIYPSKRWRGATANIHPTSNEADYVWGVLYKITFEDKKSLEIQEGVKDGIYEQLELVVESEDGAVYCMAYALKKQVRSEGLKNGKPLPSATYKNLIIRGAKENKLPMYYVHYLELLRDNGYDGDVDLNTCLTLTETNIKIKN